MKYVEIKRAFGDEIITFRAWLDPVTGEVKSNLPERIWDVISRGIDNITDYGPQAIVRPAIKSLDGIKFLENLQFALKGYYRAGEVLEEAEAVVA